MLKISISELLGPLHDIQDKNCLLELLLLSDVCFEVREGRGSTDSIHPSIDTTWWWRRRRGNHSAAAVLSWISCRGTSNSEMHIFNVSQLHQALSKAYGHQSLCSIPLKKPPYVSYQEAEGFQDRSTYGRGSPQVKISPVCGPPCSKNHIISNQLAFLCCIGHLS